MACTSKPQLDHATQVRICVSVVYYVCRYKTTFLCFHVFEFTGRPGIFNMRDRAKWDAWKAVEGIVQTYICRSVYILFVIIFNALLFIDVVSFLLVAAKTKDEAMNDYITKVKQLLEAAAASA